MTIAEQTKLQLEALAPWAKSYAGQVKVANDKPHLFELLGAAPGAPRAAVYFVEEILRGNYTDVTGKVDRRFWICISRGRGFNVHLGESLTKGVAGGAPMFVLCEEAREMVRGIRLADQTDDDTRPVYKGIFPIEFEGATVDAYYIEVLLAADIPEQTGDDLNP